MFKKLLVLLSMLAALAMSAVAFAAPAKSHQQMVIDAARAEVPAAAVFYVYKEEDGEAVLNFRDNDNYLESEVVLATTKVKKVEIKGSNIAGSTMMVKTPEDIRQIVLEAYPDARNIVIKTEKEGNNVHYDVEFVTARYKVDADMNPVTGAFAKRELEYF